MAVFRAYEMANGGVEVTDVSIENIPQPATVKTCQDAICVFQRAQIGR